MTVTYKELRAMAKDFDQKSKYHDLPLLAHIDKAVAYAKKNNFPAHIVEALEWHDFGKLFCFTEEVEGVRHFIGHHKESAKLYPGENECIRNLIYEHNTPVNQRLINKYGFDFCQDLILMQEADNYAHSEFAITNDKNVANFSKAKEVLAMARRQDKINKRLKSDFKFLEEKGFEVVGVFLQGSQNYGLDTEQSDIDTKAIVLPTFEDFINNKQAVSETLVLESNEHIDVKDIRIMFDVLKKSNINFLEILFTKHRLLNKKYSALLAPLFINNERLTQWHKKALYNSISGMTQQKLVALKHPYPSIIAKIEKFGYDPKQLHHIFRQHDFIVRLAAGESFKDCLTANNPEHLIKIKAGVHTLEDAERLGKEYTEKVFELKNKLIAENKFPIDEDAIEIYNAVKTNILRQWFKEELTK
jgi:hypothetical protein